VIVAAIVIVAVIGPLIVAVHVNVNPPVDVIEMVRGERTADSGASSSSSWNES
jgi:hypothetical protein